MENTFGLGPWTCHTVGQQGFATFVQDRNNKVRHVLRHPVGARKDGLPKSTGEWHFFLRSYLLFLEQFLAHGWKLDIKQLGQQVPTGSGRLQQFADMVGSEERDFTQSY